MSLEHISNNEVHVAMGDSIVVKTKEEAIEIINKNLKYLNFSPRIFRRLSAGETIEIKIQTTEDAWDVEADGDSIQLEKKESSFLIKAMKAGKTVINATAGELKNSMDIEVYGETVDLPDTQLTLNPEETSVAIGAKVIVDVTTDASDFTVKSKNAKKATAAKKGSNQVEITGKAEGTGVLVEVTAQAEGKDPVTKNITVSVVKADTQLNVTPNSLTFKVDEQSEVVTIETDAEDYTVEIEPSDAATFDKSSKKFTGKVEKTAKAKFSATAANKNPKEVDISLTVQAKA